MPTMPRWIDRCVCWVAYQIVVHYPGNVYDEGWQRSLWMWLLPYAGSYAHYWSEPVEYRRQIDALNR